MGFIFLALEPWAEWSGVGLGSLTPEVSLPIFIYHRLVWDYPFHVSTPPFLLDEYDIFNSLLAGLPQLDFLMMICDHCFVVLLQFFLWLCKEASRVNLCLRLDWKSLGVVFF